MFKQGILLFVYVFRYEPIHEIIDERWYNQLNKALHVANYYLKPMIRYYLDFQSTSWMKG